MSTKTGSGKRTTSLTRIRLRNFTAFSDFSLDLSPGVNVFVGKNGVGKTHLMKVCYAACEVARTGIGFGEKLVRVFRPCNSHLGRLVTRQPGGQTASIEVARRDRRLTTEFGTWTRDPSEARTDAAEDWKDEGLEATFIPVEEVLSEASGNLASDDTRELQADEIRADLLSRAFRHLTPGADPMRERLLHPLRTAHTGRVIVEDNEFYLESQGRLEISLVADSEQRLGLLWRLLRNGTLRPGCTLFWDSPETGLNPGVLGAVMETILELQRVGAQVILATHDYVVLKELDLRRKNGDALAFHSLFHNGENREVERDSADHYSQIRPNAIAEAFSDLYYRSIREFADAPT